MPYALNEERIARIRRSDPRAGAAEVGYLFWT